MSPFSPICIFFIVVLLFRNLSCLKFSLLKVLSFLLPSLILSFVLFSFHCKQLHLSKTYINSQFISLYCFHSLEKKCNIILLTLQYNLMLKMPFLLTIATLFSANSSYPPIPFKDSILSKIHGSLKTPRAPLHNIIHYAIPCWLKPKQFRSVQAPYSGQHTVPLLCFFQASNH